MTGSPYLEAEAGCSTRKRPPPFPENCWPLVWGLDFPQQKCSIPPRQKPTYPLKIDVLEDDSFQFPFKLVKLLVGHVNVRMRFLNSKSQWIHVWYIFPYTLTIQINRSCRKIYPTWILWVWELVVF